MKIIYLLRHAKSSWDDPSAADIERRLNVRGRRAAQQMGEFAKQNGIDPAIIICSTAVRTEETASIFLPAAGINAKMIASERVYEATAETLIKLLAESDDKRRSVMLIGHNPGIEGIVFLLTGEREIIPTATLVTLSIDAEKWCELRPNCGKLEAIVRPKDLSK